MRLSAVYKIIRVYFAFRKINVPVGLSIDECKKSLLDSYIRGGKSVAFLMSTSNSSRSCNHGISTAFIAIQYLLVLVQIFDSKLCYSHDKRKNNDLPTT